VVFYLTHIINKIFSAIKDVILGTINMGQKKDGGEPMLKKIFLMSTLVVFLLGLAVPAFAVSPFDAEPVKHSKSEKFNQGKCGMDTLIKDSLKKNNGDLSRVKQDVDKFIAEKKVQREAKLQEVAKEKGITVDELKAQFKQKHQQRLEEKAAQKGVKPDELKQKMLEKRAPHMEKWAKDLGLTPEQLKQILPAHPEK
jgi:uncharacterized protein YdbL (DUF1318 family)